MARRDVSDFMRHHARHLGFVVGVEQNAGVDEEEAAGQREGVDLFRIDDLDGERNLGVGVAHQVLPDPVDVFRDDRIVDNLGLPLDFLGHLLAQRDFFLDRVEVHALADIAIADFVGVLFLAAGEGGCHPDAWYEEGKESNRSRGLPTHHGLREEFHCRHSCDLL